MNDIEVIQFIVDNVNEQALLADGFNSAIIGFEVDKGKVIYDYDKCIDILMIDEEMSIFEAEEYMNYNVIDAHMGMYTPIFIRILRR